MVGVGESKLLDLDSVEVGQTKRTELKLSNLCAKDLVVNLADDEQNLAKRGISLSPSCFLLKKQKACFVTLKFSPTSVFQQRDEWIRFHVGNTIISIAQVRARSHQSSTADIGETNVTPTMDNPLIRKSLISNSSLSLSCPGDVLNSKLSDMGWGVMFLSSKNSHHHRHHRASERDNGLLCLQHIATGCFLGIQ